MNICIVPAWYPKDEKDVTAIFFREQAQALSKRGHNVSVVLIEPVSIKKVFKQKWHEKSFWQDKNIPTYFHRVIIPIPKRFEALQDKYIFRVYKKILKKHLSDCEKDGKKVDLIHSHVAIDASYYCVHAAKKLSIPVVVTEHFSRLMSGEIREQDKRRVKYTIENSDKFIFVGSRMQETVCNMLDVNKATYVIHNLINVNKFVTVDNKNDDCFTFLTACHLVEKKRVYLVIKAFAKAFKDNKNVRLIIAGDGAERSNLENLTEELDIRNKVQFFGRYTRDEGKELFGTSDAFVLTSRIETFGIVYIEATASGLPIIATKGQGGDDIVNESNGFLVQYGNIDELAEKMRYIYENKEKYDKKQIRQDCINRFSEDAVCDKIEKVYKEVLNG